MKRCIYHYPNPLESKPGVGSAVRPYQMLQAFRKIGYEVDVISGYSPERKKIIKQVSEKIKNGVKYDFVYSESVNSPTLMTDADHIPRHPFMDFCFFQLCKKYAIPVGLFYRDVYWKFPVFTGSVSLIKQAILIPMFQYDLLQYQRQLDLIYLPTMRMQQYALHNFPSRELPPGGVLRPESYEKKRRNKPVENQLRIFYVGSLSELYDNRMLFQAVQETPNVYLTVCTHQKQWEKCLPDYQQYLCDRIEVVHKSGDALREYYENADIAAYCLCHDEYLDMAMPIKVFEAISYGTPLLATNIYSIANLICRENIGWVAETSVEGIKSLLAYLKTHPEEIVEKTENTIKVALCNTWECRAQQVADDLTGITKKERSS